MLQPHKVYMFRSIIIVYKNIIIIKKENFVQKNKNKIFTSFTLFDNYHENVFAL